MSKSDRLCLLSSGLLLLLPIGGGWAAGVEGKLLVVTRWHKVHGAGNRSCCTESEREGGGLVLKRERQRKTRDNAGERKRERLETREMKVEEGAEA